MKMKLRASTNQGKARKDVKDVQVLEGKHVHPQRLKTMKS